MTDNDGRNASDGRVYVSTQSNGSIYDVAREQGINPADYADDRNSYGINNSLGLRNERNQEATAYRTEAADMGGGMTATRDGFNVSGGQLMSGDVIRLPDGMEVSYDDAVAYGLIKPGSGGKPRPATETELDQASGQQDEPQQPPPKGRDSDGLGPEAHDVVTRAIARDEDAFINATGDILASEDGSMSPEATEELAKRLGVAPEEAARQTAVAIAGYTSSLSD